jgi:hypothetical protein
MQFHHRVILVLGAFLLAGPVSRAEDALAWPPITSQTKPWAFNWWMGSAVDPTNLTHELERYAAVGLGGIHIIPIYGAKGFEDKYIPYLSPRWMEMLGWSVTEAQRLGMGVDMTTGTGWCFGGPQVTDDDANASVVVKTFELKSGEKLAQKFPRPATQALVAYAPDGRAVELTDKIATDGQIDWSAPAGAAQPWTVYAISQKPSGQKVKRAAPGGEGWMVNLIYPQAVDDLLQPYTQAFAAYQGPKPRAQYHDSYEYRSDWSPDFFAEFEQRRGYRLQTELPALFGTNNSEHAARVKCDYRQTVSEIMAEESLPKWVKWSHEHGFITRDQAHGSPGNWLDLYATADIPETEMFHSDRSKLISKFASSAAHVTGKPLVSAETGTWLEEHFTEKLSDVKYLFDDMFLSGVNHVFYHGCCYSPDEAGWPGWHFYASLEMNPRNSIWHDAVAVNAYAARVQSVLQSGQPDNDVLLYWPVADFWMQPGDKLLPQLTVHARDWFEGQPIGKAAKELWERGYAFDYVSDAQLKTVRVAGGAIQLPGGKYQVVIVPDCRYLPLDTFKQLLSIAERGGRVIFQKGFPTDVSGAGKVAERQAELKALVATLKPVWNGNRSPGFDGYRIGQGSIYTGGSASDGLKSLDYENEVTCESLVAAGLSFVRRSGAGGWHYFIANRTSTNFDGWISLGRPAKSVVLLDPLTGRVGVATTREFQRSVSLAKKAFVSPVELHLQLKAGESVIVRALADAGVVGPAWTYWTPSGAPVALRGDWRVNFLEGGPVLPAAVQTNQLVSWTQFPDTNTAVFAGTAKYALTFAAPSAASDHFELNLGAVAQSARVRVNGRDYGTLITPPFRVVVDHLKPAGNTLEVEVTSVAANRIRDLDRRGVKWKVFRDINIVDINYKPFDASNWPLTDCGLLGPVTLTPVAAQ